PGQRLLMVRDITERERENRIRADFVANASHELRTPLTVLLGYLHSMQEDSSVPTHWQEPMEEMASQVGRMQALVEDLLHLNQLESTVDAPTDPVPLRKLIKRVCKDAKRMAGERLNVDWECDEHVSLLGDRKVLRSVLTNLVSNAVRFTPRGGRVHIRWQVDERGGHIEVTDTGIGIAAEDFSRLTERFYRTDRGRARHDGGTGIGLAIVKHGLSIHQARLEIESEIDRGSTFRCVFPAARIIAQAGATLSAQTDEVNHG
ncbi:MAG: ATP-binding protein, partial [Pseudomonadota bacterium]